MPEILPRLRMDLDFGPSPVPDRPGLLIRDPYQYSDAVLIVPPLLVECLQFFNGQTPESDLRSALFELTGDLRSGDIAGQMRKMLSEAGFVEDAVSAGMKERRHAEFAAAAVRVPAHAGAAYPDDPDALRARVSAYLRCDTKRSDPPAVAAPHVSPDGGAACYGAAYAALGGGPDGRTWVILGTSHYGEPERFGVTRKRFATPLGEALTDTALVDELERKAGPAIKTEDYCHAVEHSIEFQVVFLQHLYGPGVRILPVLCGPFAHSLYNGGVPEDDEGIRRVFDALGEMSAREGSRLGWIVGVDMAHIGRRYGDPYPVEANRGRMLEVEQKDRERIALLSSGDAAGFWSAVQSNQDELHWCGTSPFYTFLKANPGARGELLDYRQWNIDEQSVVTFGAMAFRNG